METLSAPIIMHSNVLESKCLQLDAGMIHTYPLATKKKRPNQNKTIKKRIIKNDKAQHRAAG